MPPDLSPIVDLVEQHRPRTAREGFPAHVRVAVVHATREGMRVGLSITGIAGRIGLAAPTLQRWLAAAPAEPTSAEPVLTFVPLQAASSPRSSTGLTWTSPSGHRVDGLTLDDIAELLRRVA